MPLRNQFKTNEEYNLYFRQYRAKNKVKIRKYGREYNKAYRKRMGIITRRIGKRNPEN